MKQVTKLNECVWELKWLTNSPHVHSFIVWFCHEHFRGYVSWRSAFRNQIFHCKHLWQSKISYLLHPSTQPEEELLTLICSLLNPSLGFVFVQHKIFSGWKFCVWVSKNRVYTEHLLWDLYAQFRFRGDTPLRLTSAGLFLWLLLHCIRLLRQSYRKVLLLEL